MLYGGFPWGTNPTVSSIDDVRVCVGCSHLLSSAPLIQTARDLTDDLKWGSSDRMQAAVDSNGRPRKPICRAESPRTGTAPVGTSTDERNQTKTDSLTQAPCVLTNQRAINTAQPLHSHCQQSEVTFTTRISEHFAFTSQPSHIHLTPLGLHHGRPTKNPLSEDLRQPHRR